MNMVPFDFRGEPIRILTNNQGEPWFIAKEVAQVLGYSNPLDAVSKHCKCVVKDGFAERDSIGRMQKTPIIPERDLYRLVMKSQLPSAEEFEEWVVGEVLPSIRRTGGYQAASVPALPQDYIQALEHLLEAKKSEQAAIAERDRAIATKAEIGTRREATAMAKASVAVREANRLRDQLGQGASQATITAVEIALGRKFGKQGFRPLQCWCKEQGILPVYVQDARYGHVRAWPASAWAAVYEIDLAQLFGVGEACP